MSQLRESLGSGGFTVTGEDLSFNPVPITFEFDKDGVLDHPTGGSIAVTINDDMLAGDVADAIAEAVNAAFADVGVNMDADVLRAADYDDYAFDQDHPFNFENRVVLHGATAAATPRPKAAARTHRRPAGTPRRKRITAASATATASATPRVSPASPKTTPAAAKLAAPPRSHRAYRRATPAASRNVNRISESTSDA